MPKKKKAASDAVEIVAQDADEATPIGDADDAPAHWTIGTWKERDNFECAYCAFSSLHENVIAEHYRGQHAPPPPPRSPIVVADARGRVIGADG